MVPVNNYDFVNPPAYTPVFKPNEKAKPLTDYQTSWTYPPFSGAVDHGRIYGRGTALAWIPVANLYILGKLLINKGFGWALVIVQVIISILTSTTTVTVNVVDQYGKAFAAQPTVTDNQAFNFGAVTESKKGNEVIVGQYEFTATAKDTGAQTIEVVLDGTTIKATVNVNVAPASELVQSIVISGEGVKEGKATVALKHNTSNAIDLNVIGKDLNNAEVSVNQSEVIWTSSDESVATIAQDGKVTTKEITDGKDKEVTFTADLFGKKYEVKFTVSAKASQLATGTLAIANPSTVDGDKDVEGVQIVLGANNADANVGPIVTDGEIVITFTGVDQGGGGFAPAVISNSLNASIATAVATGDTVKITAAKAGETKVRVTVGAEEILIPVKVTQEAVDAATGKPF